MILYMVMNTVKIIVERAADGTYSAYGESVPAYGMGDTADVAKTEALKGLEIYLQENKAENIPDVLKGSYEVVYQMDVQSLLDYYKGIFTNAAFERITGVNQRQMQHYASGYRNPGPVTKKKIEAALHRLGSELLSLEL